MSSFNGSFCKEGLRVQGFKTLGFKAFGFRGLGVLGACGSRFKRVAMEATVRVL